MNTSRIGKWPLLAVALLCFSACGKKSEDAPTPVLSAPGAVEKIAAQAEVKASSGSIELTLLLHRTRIKAGESLWQQIRIRNVGAREIHVPSHIFNDPRELRGQSASGYGIYLEALGPDGKPLEVKYHTSAYQDSHISEETSGLLEVEGPKERAMLDRWKKQGLSEREIGMKLIDFNTRKRRAAEIHQNDPIIKLGPGQSAETKSAFFYSIQDKIHNRPMPRPIGDFEQVDFFELKKPGEYKIRAVYDFRPTKKSAELSRQLGLPAYAEEVQLRTPWIPIAVLP